MKSIATQLEGITGDIIENPNGDIHMNWRAWAVRNRLDTQHGDHDNQLIWAYTGNGGAGTPGAALTLRSFLTLDQWLTNIENDPSDRPIEQKVRAGNPERLAAELADLVRLCSRTFPDDIAIATGRFEL